jgi:hypothetical protein
MKTMQKKALPPYGRDARPLTRLSYTPHPTLEAVEIWALVH